MKDMHQVFPRGYGWMDGYGHSIARKVKKSNRKIFPNFYAQRPPSDDNEDKCPPVHFLGCPFLTRPLRGATVMSSC